jgi:sialate O-acetylesterase
MKKIISVFLIGISLANLSFANITLPAIIGTHMVLQQQTTITLWGWCDPMEEVKIKTGWDTTTYKAIGDNRANWKITINSPAASGPHTINFSGYNKLTIEDVMIGEVWLCGGQSNMEFSANKGIKQALEEAPNANNTSIRFFYVEKASSDVLQNDCKGEWKVCTPEEMKRFSAIGYFFGKKLQQDLNVPVGLINANWGGTPGEVWMPAELISNDSLLVKSKGKLWASDEWWPVQPGVCYNAMIFPISNFTLAGVIWYQGESNTDAAFTYRKLFSTLIGSWRKAWKSELPFYYVQIAPSSHYQGQYSGALLREAQAQCLAIPHTGMIVVSDLITDIGDIHPQNKKDVGVRLANYALSEQYNKPGISYKSPMYKSMEVNGSKVIISFINVLTGIKSLNGPPTSFLIAGVDKVFLPAEATIKGDKVIVLNKKIKHPVEVRFAFNNTDIPNLFSNEGLPVASFRTDNWEIKP